MLSEVTIGRDAACDVRIDNAGVSRKHAVLSYAEGCFRIRDAESENGITLNGRTVEDAKLQYGDVVGINKFKLHFSAAGGVPPEMLEPPERTATGVAQNVVATMTVNAEAARAMQNRFVAEREAGRAGETPAQGANWPWFVAAAGLVGVASYLLFRLL